MTLSLGGLDPFRYPEEWQAIYIAGHKSPGLAIVKNASRGNEWDVKRGKGAKGATITYTGDVPAEFSVEIQLWKPQHYADWLSFQTLLAYDASKKKIQAIQISHPSLATQQITAVVTKKVTCPEQREPGLYIVTIDFLEFRVPKANATGTPNGAPPAPPPGGKVVGDTPDPVGDAQQKQIKALLAEAEAP